MGIERKEKLTWTIFGIIALICSVSVFVFAKHKLETMVGLIIVLIAICFIYVLIKGSSIDTYLSLPKEVKRKIKNEGKIIRIENIVVKKEDIGLSEFNEKLFRYDVKRVVVLSNGKRFAVQEYFYPNSDDKITECSVFQIA